MTEYGLLDQRACIKDNKNIKPIGEIFSDLTKLQKDIRGNIVDDIQHRVDNIAGDLTNYARKLSATKPDALLKLEEFQCKMQNDLGLTGRTGESTEEAIRNNLKEILKKDEVSIKKIIITALEAGCKIVDEEIEARKEKIPVACGVKQKHKIEK